MKSLCGKHLGNVPYTTDPSTSEKTCEACLRIAASKRISIDVYSKPLPRWSWHVAR